MMESDEKIHNFITFLYRENYAILGEFPIDEEAAHKLVKDFEENKESVYSSRK